MNKKYLDNFFNYVSNSNEHEVFTLALPITLIYKKMYQESETFFKDSYDLLHSDIDVLASLYFNKKQLSPTELYEATVFSSGGMTKVLKKLQDRGLISRFPSKVDKRSMLVCLTQKGEDLIIEALLVVAKSKEEIFANLTKKERENLEKTLSKITYSFVK